MTPEAKMLMEHLAGIEGGHGVLTTKQTREMLLETSGQMFRNGRLMEIKAKPIGAGVYRITLEPWKHEEIDK